MNIYYTNYYSTNTSISLKVSYTQSTTELTGSYKHFDPYLSTGPNSHTPTTNYTTLDDSSKVHNSHLTTRYTYQGSIRAGEWSYAQTPV